jgi:hypothetical protein
VIYAHTTHDGELYRVDSSVPCTTDPTRPTLTSRGELVAYEPAVARCGTCDKFYAYQESRYAGLGYCGRGLDGISGDGSGYCSQQCGTSTKANWLKTKGAKGMECGGVALAARETAA